MSKVLYKPMVIVGQSKELLHFLDKCWNGPMLHFCSSLWVNCNAILWTLCENARSKLFKCSANVLPMTMMSSTYTRQVVPCRPLRTKLKSLKGGRCISKDKRHDVEFKKPFSFAQSSLFASIHFQVPPANSRW